jgi:hypothetical protein
MKSHLSRLTGLAVLLCALSTTPIALAAGTKTTPDPMRHSGVGTVLTPLPSSKATRADKTMAAAFRREFSIGPGVYPLSEDALEKIFAAPDAKVQKELRAVLPLSFSDGSSVTITVDRRAKGIILVEQ